MAAVSASPHDHNDLVGQTNGLSLDDRSDYGRQEPDFERQDRPAYGHRDTSDNGYQGRSEFGREERPDYGREGRQDRSEYGREERPDFDREDTQHFDQEDTPHLGQEDTRHFDREDDDERIHGEPGSLHDRSAENGVVTAEPDNVHNSRFADGYNGPVERVELASAVPNDPSEARENYNERPGFSREPSRSYARSIPIVTTYEPELSDNASMAKRRSQPVSVRRASSTKESIRPTNQERPPTRAETIRSPSRVGSVKATSVKAPSAKAPSVKAPSMKAQSVRNTARDSRDGTGIGEVLTPERQLQLQGVSLHDQGPMPRFEENNNAPRSMSPRPQSAFGYRPQPNLISVAEDGRESRYDGHDSRMGQVNRSGTVLSRANTNGRNGTMSRAANGGTVGSRRGAFGRGAGASIGTQPEEVLGRDDIHTRAELSERILDDATLRRLSTMEKKDASRLAKVLKSEGKAEAAAVKGGIKELERLSKLQKEAAYAERKSQMRLSKYTSKEHKARLRFLKEKERYERVEGDLRNAENDYEERRDHAAGLTGQVAEKTQELDDLRGQKAADDRERAVKLLALKNPGHS